MNNEDIIRAWKDDSFRESLSAEKQAMLPANPAGMIELNDQDLFGVAGAEEGTLTILSIVTFIASCSQCDTTVFDDGTCALLSAGCC